MCVGRVLEQRVVSQRDKSPWAVFETQSEQHYRQEEEEEGIDKKKENREEGRNLGCARETASRDHRASTASPDLSTRYYYLGLCHLNEKRETRGRNQILSYYV